LADAGRYVGLNAVQPLGGARHAAFEHDGAEDQEIGQVHSSLQEINNIRIIHFMGTNIPRKERWTPAMRSAVAANCQGE
jgi:hypothetical protein